MYEDDDKKRQIEHSEGDHVGCIVVAIYAGAAAIGLLVLLGIVAWLAWRAWRAARELERRERLPMRADIEQGNEKANHELVEIVAGFRKSIHETNAYLMGQILDIKDAIKEEQNARPARQREVDAKMEKITERQHSLELKAVTVAGGVIFALAVIAAGVAYLVLR